MKTIQNALTFLDTVTDPSFIVSVINLIKSLPTLSSPVFPVSIETELFNFESTLFLTVFSISFFCYSSFFNSL